METVATLQLTGCVFALLMYLILQKFIDRLVKSQHFIVLGWFICHFPLFKFSVQTTYSLPPEI
jgi:hypothetical protein